MRQKAYRGLSGNPGPPEGASSAVLEPRADPVGRWEWPAGAGEMGPLSLKDQRNIPRRRLPGCGEIALVCREQGVTGCGRR